MAEHAQHDQPHCYFENFVHVRCNAIARSTEDRFSRYDTENRGFLNYADFKSVVRALTIRHLGQKEDVPLGSFLWRGCIMS